jgi:hypothetical protein
MKDESTGRIPLKVFIFEKKSGNGYIVYNLSCFTEEAINFLSKMTGTGMIFRGGNWETVRAFRKNGEMELVTHRDTDE